MHINELPDEILHCILGHATRLESSQSATWTFGLSHATDDPSTRFERLKPARYVRGQFSPDALRWDNTSSIRQVCQQWHDWALGYALKTLHFQRRPGNQRWAELSTQRQLYDTYELIDKPSGFAVTRDPYRNLRSAAKLLSINRPASDKIRRLWFSGFFTPESESLIFSVLGSCRNLTSISVPWTMLRHGSSQDLKHLLGIAYPDDVPVRSLELQGVSLPHSLTDDPRVATDHHPLDDPTVDFGHLKRLKLIGNTTFMPVNDDDLAAIARTATGLEEFHVTCLSTVSIRGVMDIVKASQATLEVLDHSPRENNGFLHPDPGMPRDSEHVCDILVNCPRLRDLSISVPTMCSHLFDNDNVRWVGECQVRALGICGEHNMSGGRPGSKQETSTMKLHNVLDRARALMEIQHSRKKELDIEIFFADCIFDPVDRLVHGDTRVAEILSNGAWPGQRTSSIKGPYGSTGLYGKEEGDWDVFTENEYFRAVDAGWMTL